MSASIRGRVVVGALGAILAIAASSAFAEPPIISRSIDWSTDYTEWGHVTALETGWYDDTMSITLDPSVPFVNSSRGAGRIQESCKATNAGYALDPKDPGVKAHEAFRARTSSMPAKSGSTGRTWTSRPRGSC